MYEAFFGLTEAPFSMAPNPHTLYLSPSHVEAFSGLWYAVARRKGFAVLTGNAGTGKTTVLGAMMDVLGAAAFRSAIVFNPTLNSREFLEYVLHDFGLSETGPGKAKMLLQLQDFLLQSRREGKGCVLIVDEAHKLSPEVLEEIRLLTNFETPAGKLLQIILAGQSELDAILNREDLRQLKQRVAVRLRLDLLSAAQVREYIQYRWVKAGSKSPAPFDSRAVAELVRVSRGIPRVINTICDNALLLAFAAGTRSVTAEHIQEAAADLQLTTPVTAPAEPPVADSTAPLEPPLLTLGKYSPRGARLRPEKTRKSGRIRTLFGSLV